MIVMIVHYKPLPGFQLACGLTMGVEKATGNTTDKNQVTCPRCIAVSIATRLVDELDTQSVPQKLYNSRVISCVIILCTLRQNVGKTLP